MTFFLLAFSIYLMLYLPSVSRVPALLFRPSSLLSFWPLPRPWPPCLFATCPESLSEKLSWLRFTHTHSNWPSVSYQINHKAFCQRRTLSILWNCAFYFALIFCPARKFNTQLLRTSLWPCCLFPLDLLSTAFFQSEMFPPLRNDPLITTTELGTSVLQQGSSSLYCCPSLMQFVCSLSENLPQGITTSYSALYPQLL